VNPRIRRAMYEALAFGRLDDFVAGLKRDVRIGRRRGRLLRARLFVLHLIGKED
jgi:hypothetical protein